MRKYLMTASKLTSFPNFQHIHIKLLMPNLVFYRHSRCNKIAAAVYQRFSPLTCELQKSLPTEHGSEVVLRPALVHPIVADHAPVGDDEVPVHETVAVVRQRVDLGPIDVPTA